jgi:hypothetical protein
MGERNPRLNHTFCPIWVFEDQAKCSNIAYEGDPLGAYFFEDDPQVVMFWEVGGASLDQTKGLYSL